MLSVACFLVDSSIGLVLIPFIPIPLVGGLASAFFEAALLYICANIVPRLGAATILATIWLAMATVTPSFGPPGAYKIVIGVALGISAELVLVVLGRRPFAYMIAIAVAFALSIPITYYAWVRVGIPDADKLRGYILYLMSIYVLIGIVGCFAGKKFFDARLLKYPTIMRIRER